jgi:hypothetical protein
MNVRHRIRSTSGSGRRSLRISALVVAVGAVPGVAAAPAPATTGPGVIEARPPLFKIPQYATDLYLGGYEMKHVAHDSHIVSSSMTIQEAAGTWGLFTGGVIQFYGYQTDGQEQSWVATLYDARIVKHNPNKISMNILDTDDDKLGSLTLQRLHDGSLAGVLVLPKQANAYNQNGYPGTFAIYYKKTRITQPPVSLAGVNSQKLQGYEIPGPAPAGLKGVKHVPRTSPGWGSTSSYTGSYQLASASSPDKTATGGASSAQAPGIFGFLIAHALEVSSSETPGTGELKLGASRGTLTLAQAAGPLRVTGYSRYGSTRAATLTTPAGKHAGTLQITRLDDSGLTATVNLAGQPQMRLRFSSG